MNHDACTEFAPLLAPLAEGALPPDERDALLVHLADCAPCTAALAAEQQLTERLGARRLAPRVAWRRLAAAALAAALLLSALPLLLPSERAYGQARVVPLPLAAHGELRLEEFGRVALAGATPRDFALQASHHFVVARGEALTVEIDAVGRLEAIGPARLELEHGEPRWKLVLLLGAATATLHDGASLFVVSALGERVFHGGRHVVALDAATFAPDEAAGGSADGAADLAPARLLELGHAAFFAREEFAAAERLYRRAADHAAASGDERVDALFYWSAAIARQQRWLDAVAASDEYLAKVALGDPPLPTRVAAAQCVRYFRGTYLRSLGRDEEARAEWRRAVDLDPASEMAGHARREIDAPAPPPAQPQPQSSAALDAESRRELPAVARLPARTRAGSVRVVALGLDPKRPDDARMLAVARVAAQHHRGELATLALDPERYEAALRAFALESGAEALLLFVAPRDLDINLQRRTLRTLAALDDDLFVDCTYGWMTARDGAALAKLWERTQQVRRKGLSSREWVEPFVMNQGPSLLYDAWGSEQQRQAGFTVRGVGFAAREHDARVLDFAAAELPKLAKAGVLSFTGNGDPQGIWLFDDHRNVDAARHWKFDPERVGHDPDGSMPRLLAADFAKLQLARPIVWSGTCHCAAVGRVYVEGDIVSTFGSVDCATPYELRPGESLALAWLDAGAAALLAPIAANHGFAVDLEEEFALTHGASLGEAVKSTWDDVCAAARGPLRLTLHHAGDPIDWSEPIMQGGGANRLLIGDPTLAPFTATPPPHESVTVKERGPGRFDVVVRYEAGWHTRTWDLYGLDRVRDGRIGARIDLAALLPDGKARQVRATVRVVDGDGRALPFELRHALPEEFHGRRFLHLQANAARASFEQKALVATFSVEIEAAE